MGATAAVHPADPILQAFGLGKLDDVSSASVSQHLEECDSCQRRVAELSSDEFLGRLRQAKVTADSTGSGWSPSAGSSTEGASSPIIPPPPADTLPPELVDHADWEVVRELGRGGMGVVYLAKNKLMGRLEVLKVVGRHLVERPGVLDRFLREIQSAARLQHANIVTAYSTIRLGQSLVLTMEYVDGLDLAAMVKAKGPLPIAHATYFIYQVALGLQHAHERGMVHRDIKPANLIVASESKKSVVKVLDFGLAKVTSEGEADSTLTREGQMVGTPDYIAPEQIRDAKTADIRADIYSLGCTFYYLLTGGPPFRGPHLWDVYQAHFSMDAAPLNLARPEVPVELAAVVAKMMAKEPNRRFQRPSDVAQALTPFFKPAPQTPIGSSPKVPRVGRTSPPIVADKPVAPQPATPRTAPVSNATAPTLKSPQGVAWESLIDFKETEQSIVPLKPKPAVEPVAGRRIPWVWPALAAGVFLIGYIASMYFRTPYGTLVFDDLQKDAMITADGNTITVEWPEGKDKGHARVAIPAGKHHVQVAMNGVQVTGQEVTVASGKETRFKVNYIAPSSGTTDQTRRQQAGKPPEPPAADRPTVPTDAKLFAGKYYRVFKEFLSWHQARDKCREMGGHLAIVKNKSENGFITSLLVDTGIESAWLGATDEKLEGRWVWVDGSGWFGLEYENWDDGQPTNDGGRGPEHYMIIVRSHDGRWNDYYADGLGLSDLGFVCQWDDKAPINQNRSDSAAAKSAVADGNDVAGRTWTDSLTMMMVRIEPGTFTMGGKVCIQENPPHTVKITRPFSLGAHEVTRAQYRTVTGASPSEFPGADDLPVDTVSWIDAVQFCNKLSERERRKPYYQINGEDVAIVGGKGYRLPTEAEWEYACGNDKADLNLVAWFRANSGGKTHSVGQKQPNRRGLYDLLGNVWEWCQDAYDADYYKQSPPTADPAGPLRGQSHVVKGCSWYDGPAIIHPSHRDWNWFTRKDQGGNSLGFRVAMSDSDVLSDTVVPGN